MKHPEKLYDFYFEESIKPQADLSCCLKDKDTSDSDDEDNGGGGDNRPGGCGDNANNLRCPHDT